MASDDVELPDGAQVEAAAIAFEGYAPGSAAYGDAVLGGAFDCLGVRPVEAGGPTMRRAWPAVYQKNRGPKIGRAVWVDSRGWLRIDVPDGQVWVSLELANAAVAIARTAFGQEPAE